MTDLVGNEVEVNPLLAGYEREIFRELIFACLSPAAAGRVCKDSEMFRPNSQRGTFLFVSLSLCEQRKRYPGLGAGKAPFIMRFMHIHR